MQTVQEGQTVANVYLKNETMNVYSTGVVNVMTVDEVGIVHVSGGTINNTVINDQGYVKLHSKGLANDTQITAGGSMFVDSKGIASGTVMEGGKFEIESGGTASDTTIKGAGSMYVSGGATIKGLTTVSQGGLVTVGWGINFSSFDVHGGHLILKGDIENNDLCEAQTITVDSGGSLTVSGSAYASDATISNGFATVLNEGTLTKVTLEAATVEVKNGAKLSRADMKTGAVVNVESGGIIQKLTVSTGAVLTGVLRETDELTFDGGTLDLNIAGMNPSDEVLIGSQAFSYVVSGSYGCTLTVNSSGQTEGTYRLIEDVPSFDKTITVKDTSDKTIGTLSVGGSLTNGLSKYTLGLDGSGLFVTVATPNIFSDDVTGVTKDITGDWIALNVNVNEAGVLNVHEGGVASKTTVNEKGILSVYDGGVASDTTIKNKGFMEVYEGGSANGAVIEAKAELFVSSNGTAEDIKVLDGGRLTVTSNTTVKDIDADAGAKLMLVLGSGIYAEGQYNGSSFTLDKTVNGFTVHGGLYIYDGGKANNTTVDAISYFYVTSGGSADHTTIKQYAYMHVLSGGSAGNTVVNGEGDLYVSKGGVANGVTVDELGRVRVFSGGIAQDTLIVGGSLTLSQGVANGVNVGDKGYVFVSSGGVANDVTAYGKGEINVSAGGVASNVVLNYDGEAYINGRLTSASVNMDGRLVVNQGGVASDVYVAAGGILRVDGRLTGHTTFETGADINTYFNTAYLDFDLTQTAPGAPALANGLSVVADNQGFHYTLIVDGSVVDGKYTLAEYASGFNSTITVQNTYGTELGSIDLGSTATIGGRDYTLELSGAGTLSLTVGEVTGPALTGNLTSVYHLAYAQVASGVNILDGGHLYVEDGAYASQTTVKTDGYLTVSSGGLMLVTAVSGGLAILSGGVASDTVISDGGIVHIVNGVASDTDIYNGCALVLLSPDAVAKDFTVHAGGYLYLNGEDSIITGRITFENGANVWHNDGKTGILNFDLTKTAADDLPLVNNLAPVMVQPFTYTLTVSGSEAYGDYNLAEGAAGFNKTITVQDTLGNTLGTLKVGGTQTFGSNDYELTLSDTGSLGITVVAPPDLFGDLSTTVSLNAGQTGKDVNILDGGELTVLTDAFIGQTTVNSNGDFTLAGGSADIVTVNFGGDFYVNNGGKATKVTENGGYVSYDEGTTTVEFLPNSFEGFDYKNAADWATLHSGTTGTDLTAGNGGGIYVYDGGIATNTTIENGGVFVLSAGGRADGVTVNGGGALNVSEGATLTGKISVAGGALVDVEAGAILNFDLTKTAAGEPAPVADLSFADSKPFAYTLTIDGTEANGNYKLAEGANNFTGTITVKDTSGVTLDTITVKDGTKKIGGMDYTLTLSDTGSLGLTIAGYKLDLTGNLDKWYELKAGKYASSVDILYGGRLCVTNGALASQTAVDYYGQFDVYEGGIASQTTVSSDGYFYVYEGGFADQTTVSSGGRLEVSGMGSATGIVAEEGAYLGFGVATNTYAAGTSAGVLFEITDTLAGYTIHSGYLDVCDGGIVNNTTVDSGADLYVGYDGKADGITVSSGGRLEVSGMGSATGIVAEEGADLIFQVGPGCKAQGTYAGSAFDITDTVAGYTIHSGYLDVNKDGKADDVTVDPGGALYVSNGGTATNVRENGGYVDESTGAIVTFAKNEFTGLDLGAYQYATVHSGTTATETYIFGNGCFYIFDGGIANDTQVAKNGNLVVSNGGLLNSARIYDNANLYVSGGKLTGRITFGETAKVTACDGAILDFDLTQTVPSGAPLVTNLSPALATDFAYTLTVSGTEADGKYRLAGGAAGFNKTITVKNTLGVTIDTITVAEGPKTIGGRNYELTLKDGNLGLTLGDGGEPGVDLAGDLTADFDLGNGMVGSDVNILDGGELYVYEGGIASKTTVNSGGYFYVYEGGIASKTTVNSHGVVYIDDSGSADVVDVNLGGDFYVYEGGTATNVRENGGYVGVQDGATVEFVKNSFDGLTIGKYDWTTVHSGTTATNTVVGSNGYLVVFDKGFAGITTVESDGELLVKSGGVAENADIASGGFLIVSGGGSATGITAADGAIFFLSVAPDTYVKGTYAGSAFEITDTATGYTIHSGGRLYVSGGGTANNTTVESGGNLSVSGGGKANGVNVASGGYMGVESGGSATGIDAADGAMLFFEVAQDTYAQGKYAGSAFEISDAVTGYAIHSGGRLYVSSGGMADGITAEYGGNLRVFTGGTATQITENGGEVWLSDSATVKILSNEFTGLKVKDGNSATVHSGTTATDTTLSDYGKLHVYSGGIASGTTLESDGFLYVNSGGVASGVMVKEGGSAAVWEKEGTINGITVAENGVLRVSSGGRITGKMTFAEFASIYAQTGAILDFDLTQTAPGADALVNDLNFNAIKNNFVFTLTVDGTLAAGDYKLGEGMTVEETVTVVNTTGMTLGTLTVDGGKQTLLDGRDYTLTLNGKSLGVTLGAAAATDTLKPEVANMKANFTYPTNQNVTVKADFFDNMAIEHRYYKFAMEDPWLDYTDGGVLVTENNTTVYFQAVDKAGLESDVVPYTVSNIDRVLPTITIIPSTTEPAASVTITAKFDDNMSLEWQEYRIGDGEWEDYTGPVTVTENTTVSFHATDTAGNEVTSSCEVKNITGGGGGVTPDLTGDLDSEHHLTAGQVGSDVNIILGGKLHVENGARTSQTTLKYGELHISNGGVAINTTANLFGGIVYVSEGGIAEGVTLNSGAVHVSNGGTASNVTINLSGGINIYGGGIVSGAEVAAGGGLYVMDSGAYVSGIVAEAGAKLAFVVASDTYEQGTYDGSPFEIGSTVKGYTVHSKGRLDIESGGTATDTTVTDGGKLYVSSGGTANGVNHVAAGGSAVVGSGGSMSGIVAEAGAKLTFVAASNTYAQGTYDGSAFEIGSTVKGYTVQNNGILYVEDGGIATGTTVANGGNLYVFSGGTAADTTVAAGGKLSAGEDGKLTGKLTINAGATVKFTEGAILDFDLTKTTVGADALVNSLSFFLSTPGYTLTVDGTVAAGDYKLAEGADGFEETITVVNTSGVTLDTITVAEGTKKIGGRDYTLKLTGSLLSVTLGAAAGDTTPPVISNVKADITGPTNQNVTVTADFTDNVDADVAIKQYRIGDGAWQDYTTGVVVGNNATVSFKATDSAGNTCDPVSITVNNIDKELPTITGITQNTTAPAQSVTVTAEFSDNVGLASKQYRIGDGAWADYTAPVTVTENTTVSFRATDTAGNTCDPVGITVSNIDNEQPTITGIAQNTTAPAASVTVTAVFADNVGLASKQYRIGTGGAWQTYTDSGVVMTKNDTVYFKATDTAGNVREVSHAVTNISLGPVPDNEPENNSLYKDAKKKTLNEEAILSFYVNGDVPNGDSMIYLDPKGSVESEDGKYFNSLGRTKNGDETVDDASDYAKLVLTKGAALQFSVDSTVAGTLYVYERTTDAKGNVVLKQRQKIGVKANKPSPAKLSAVYLEKGEYYVGMETKLPAVKKAAELSAYYNVNLTGTRIYSDGDEGANNGNLLVTENKKKVPSGKIANFLDAPITETGEQGKNVQFDANEIVAKDAPAVDGGWKNFVGFGDDSDSVKLSMTQPVELSFTLEATDNVKLIVYSLSLNAKSQWVQKTLQTVALSLKKIQEKGTASSKKTLLLDRLVDTTGKDADGVTGYYVSVQSTNAAKGGSAYYNVTAKASVYSDADESIVNETGNGWLYDKKTGKKNSEVNLNLAENMEITNGKAIKVDKGDVNFVGFGDEFDYAAFTVSADGKYSFTLETDGAAKFTVYSLTLTPKGDKYTQKAMLTQAIKKATTGDGVKTKEIGLMAGVTYYVSMQSTGAKKGDAVYYSITANLSGAKQGAALDMPDDGLFAAQSTDALAGVAAYDIESQLIDDRQSLQSIAMLA